MHWLIGIFIILHGMVHTWYVVLSFNWVTFQPDMGWTGTSWLLTPLFETRSVKKIAGFLFALAGLVFIVSGIFLLSNNDTWQSLMLGSAIFSGSVIILFWDGKFSMLMQKGVIGLIIDLVIVVYLTVFI